MATVNLGRVKPIHKGDYSSLTTYKELDLVKYQSLTYICLQEATGILPTNTAYFRAIADVTELGILDLLKAVDGAGSGLDADLLDGQQGSYYLPAASYTASDVLTKIKTVDGASSGLDADLLDGSQGADYAKLASPSLTGVPTAPTAAVATNTTQIATTAFVQRSLGNIQGYAVPATGSSIAGSEAGKLLALNAPSTYTLPDISTVPIGAAFYFFAVGTGAVVQRFGANSIFVKGGTTVTSLTLNSGDTLTLIKADASTWIAPSGTAQLKYAESFATSFASSGYQKLPSGLIIQWGRGGPATTQTITFPIAFNTVYQAVLGPQSTTAYSASTESLSNTGMTIYAEASVYVRWVAIGI